MVLVKARTIRAYRPEDAAALVQIHNNSYPANQMRPNAFSRYFNDLHKAGGKGWTILENREPVGYACIAPVPGLEGVLDLQGCIIPTRRRRGLGSRLLEAVIKDLEGNGRYQLSHAVHSLNSPAARFLQHHQFEVEHIEQQLLLEKPDRLDPVSLPPGFQLATYPLEMTVRSFRQAYDAAFQGLPWFQPYTSDEEVTADLETSSDLVFLLDGEKTAGFAWLRMPEQNLGEVEPFGLLPAYQGRGLGAKFLTAVIHRLIPRGAENIRIGAWERNERAIRLYQRLGFKHTNTQSFLAYNIQ